MRKIILLALTTLMMVGCKYQTDAKMKEAGYEWDSEKKELKKIEVKTLNADKVIEWLKNNGWCTVGGPKVEIAQINKFKKDFGLC